MNENMYRNGQDSQTERLARDCSQKQACDTAGPYLGQQAPKMAGGLAAAGSLRGPGARWMLANKARILREAAAELDALAGSLPAEIPAAADAAICALLSASFDRLR
jgi:hypothetical protein